MKTKKRLVFTMTVFTVGVIIFTYVTWANGSLTEYSTSMESSFSWFQTSLPHDLNNTTDVNVTDLNKTQYYLHLVNSINEDLSLYNVPDERKYQAENVIRFAYGLRPYTTEQGEAAWIENGIVYRPWRRPLYPPGHSSPFTAEYEIYIPFNEELFFEGKSPDPKYKSERKIILWYKPSRPANRENGLGHLRACPDFPCHMTTNLKFKDNSSAMVFASQLVAQHPPSRRPDQMFILHNDEPEHSSPKYLRNWFGGLYSPGWKKAFNWTMTYRIDSDFFAPFGVVRRRPSPLLHKNYTEIVAKKTKMAMWMTSNCKAYSQRESYVKELQKHFHVDVYGDCGKMKCPHKADDNCSKIITEEYKFYLSLESAFCPDYITEKLFHYLTMDTILVVRGTDQYYRHVPRELILNTASFSSPKELAEKMLYLHNNDTAYIEMLREKDKYMSITEDYPIRKAKGRIHFMAYELMSVPFCQVCQKLWNLDKYAKSIPDIHQWYKKKLCTPPTDTKFS